MHTIKVVPAYAGIGVRESNKRFKETDKSNLTALQIAIRSLQNAELHKLIM